jgi:hypothetical protein
VEPDADNQRGRLGGDPLVSTTALISMVVIAVVLVSAFSIYFNVG